MPLDDDLDDSESQATASEPLAFHVTAYPSRSRPALRLWATAGSSSTTRTRFHRAAIRTSYGLLVCGGIVPRAGPAGKAVHDGLADE